MNIITEPIIFAVLAAFSLLGGMAIHAIGHKLSRRVPARILRCFYASGFICAGVGLLLLGDNLLRQN